MNKLTSQQINILKYLAIFTMLLDHIARIMLDHNLALIMIGRVSFIIFAFVLAYNYIYNTSNKLNYIKRLFIFGLISQPFYMFSFNLTTLNIFITLALGLLIIYLSEQKVKKTPKANQTLIIIGLSSLFIFAADFINYSFLGIMLIGLIYCFLKNSNAKNLSLLLIATFLVNFITVAQYPENIILSVSGLVSYLIIMLVCKTNINYKVYANKWLFFAFYPLHMIILKLITLI